MSKIFIANVYVNEKYKSKYGIVNPLLDSNLFELVPIKERSDVKGEHILKYKDVKCFNSNASIIKYFPERNKEALAEYYVHYDPEFETFTYGDVLKKGNSRSSNLTRAKKGDYIFFLANLYKFYNSTYLPDTNDFYFIGYFQIDKILSDEKEIIKFSKEIRKNAHYRRYIDEFTEIGDFLIVKGTNKSKRFTYPFKITREFCDLCLRDKDNERYKWNNFKTELQCIGSYTRTIRAVINEENQPDLWNKFWNEINNLEK
ncbi:MAG: hypothetical protein P8Y97_07845 [Candidatus Lokiarchaeota archaeon]